MSGSGRPIPSQHHNHDFERLGRLKDQDTERRLAERRSRLTIALRLTLGQSAADQVPTAIAALKEWLDSWDGVGHIVVGMTAQGYNLELRQFPHGWSAAFYPSGVAHSIVHGSGWGSAPWEAVQKAALEALTRRDPAATSAVEEESPG
jgi:hypothetical protein